MTPDIIRTIYTDYYYKIQLLWKIQEQLNYEN